ncbi:NRAMP (natural resistance-associated macrophage protein)-like metal ion transporter [Sporomusaceae bacterium BoRhaA]|uniref:Nramp family divalent metal transporter n=1 Tax=Pelorhabdus rhamnosifermentans TaxID=2772457 RepID=UPI001C05EDA8|nr:Nramp family divalent metal transporter [Pelorhabdus rhamnosifermentans]MBU2699367.1 NRAMP (natural resistance-associated macrophage protein)-like metal ion transporter [Pelorhabdus rhamnosifermentans]
MKDINNQTAVSSKAIQVNGKWKQRILTFLFVMGPGIIVMVADNDAGAVSTYVQAGADYGLHLMWLLLLLLPITYFIQEMVVRLGIATGQGHAAMIYKRFGKWWGAFSLFDLLLVNFLTLVTEFAAIYLGLKGLGLEPLYAVPATAIAIIVLVITGSYLRWERTTVILCFLDLTWLLLAKMVSPDWSLVVRHTVVPSFPPGPLTPDLIFLIIAIVGTTIAPWQLFFQQSCIADKRLRFSDLKNARIDTIVGATCTIAIAACMMLVGNFATQNGVHFEDPAQMAIALTPMMGAFFQNAILLLMINAAVLGATTISLSSAWAYGEVKGWSHSLQKSFREAPGFYMVYASCVLAAAGIVLIPNAPLQTIIVSVQVLAGLMLPSAIVFLQLLLNDKELLGERFVNKPWNNWINWIVIIILFILSLTLAVQVILPNFLELVFG